MFCETGFHCSLGRVKTKVLIQPFNILAQKACCN
uniref:Uncharacterized protein n=1 Tax=Anguilla anguilla TaxID=7936 RepID=A0A0E9UPI7_ANGAN